MEKTTPQTTGGRQQRYLPVLQSCRDAALVSFGENLKDMFEHVEPALLDFIDKAETNQSQFLFIDAINTIKNRRESVERRFHEEISRGFSEFSKGQLISYPVPLLESQRKQSDGGSLELVEENDLNRRLSLQDMIEKANSNYFQLLFALRQRLSMVRGGHKLEPEDLPAGPLHTVSALHSAADEFGFDTNLLLIIYALFDKYVVRRMRPIYEDFNEQLVEAGVFPNLKFEVPPNPDRSPGGGAAGDEARQQQTPEEEQPEAGSPDVSLGEELFHSIRDLLSVRRRQDPRFAQHPDYTPSAPRRQMLDTPTLVSAIDRIQPSRGAEFLPTPGQDGELPATMAVDVEMLEQVRERLIEERENLFRGVDRNEIPSADLDTIELVGMLFEHVLNEEDLPNIAKALISHLHTPYLKVAILDHRFLIDSRHIARKLLNTMVDVGRVWIEEDDLRRGIYYPMQECVNLILAEFEDDVTLFNVVFEKLNTQVAELEQKAKVVEARAREAAKGRERLENARARAHRIVQDRVADRRFHPAAERFLNHAWLDKMILMLLRDANAENSAEWQQVLDVVDRIIEICDSLDDPPKLANLQRHLPDLRQRIENGLSSMGDFHRPDLQALLELLSSPGGTTAAQAETTATAKPSEKPAVKAEEPARTTATRTPPPAAAKPEKAPLTEEQQAMVKTLKKMRFGTWFELQDDNGKAHRLKLSWFSPVTQKYMFVDKSGVQALVTPIEVLAQQICKGRAKILKHPSLPFVDRTLDVVFGILQKPFKGKQNNRKR